MNKFPSWLLWSDVGVKPNATVAAGSPLKADLPLGKAIIQVNGHMEIVGGGAVFTFLHCGERYAIPIYSATPPVAPEDLDMAPAAPYPTEPPAQALRYNEGKVPLSMVLEARQALLGAAAVMQMGAEKYARGNWRKGLPQTEISDSLLRHLSAFLSGEDLDPESGLPHVDHVLVNALFLAEHFRNKTWDDRSPEGNKPEPSIPHHPV